jgi:hypothetical protein
MVGDPSMSLHGRQGITDENRTVTAKDSSENFLIAAIPHPSDAKQFRYTTR